MSGDRSTCKFRGRVYIDRNRCKGCGFCVEFCPPKVLVISNLFNDHGYHPPQLIREGNCTGCDLCGLYCPDFAIYGVREPVEAELAGRGVAENSSEPLAVIEKERAELVQGEGGRV